MLKQLSLLLLFITLVSCDVTIVSASESHTEIKTQKIIGVLGAMPEEIQLIKEKAKNVIVHKLNEIMTIFEGELEGKKIIFAHSGVGKTFASSVVTTMIVQFKIEALIFTGLAGAMSESLGLGDVVIGKDVIDYEMDCRNFILPWDRNYQHKLGEIPFLNFRTYAGDEKLAEIAMKSNVGVKIHSGRIATGSEFVIQSRKQDLYDKFWKDLEYPLCLEMEGSAVAQICHVYKIPFILLRAISDTFKGDANQEFEKFLKIAAEHNNQMAVFIIKNL
jgi:adenosylhomocysteine nucleosidase